MKTRLLAAVLFLISTLPCAAKPKPPIFAAPNFNPALVDRIDVFVIDPSNDTTNDRECIGGAKFGGTGPWGADNTLGKRGYNKEKHTRTRFYEAPIPITDTMLSNPSKDWLQDLSNRKYLDSKSKEIPPPGQWIMIITVDELGSRVNAIKGLGRATLSMYLFDRDQGTLLWHDQDSDQMWGGLMGNLMEKGLIKQQSCALVVGRMIHKMPKHKK